METLKTIPSENAILFIFNDYYSPPVLGESKLYYEEIITSFHRIVNVLLVPY